MSKLSLNIREEVEHLEIKTLSEFAMKSMFSQGRDMSEKPCQLRTDFQRDRDRIIHSKSFRRLKYKTQVFFAPENDHVRTRMTHTLEVCQIARTISRALKLNEDLTEAIALGHDLGHTPFGHSGEKVLNDFHPQGFRHNEQSYRVVTILENLNLTKEVKDGILTHSWGLKPITCEAQVVQLADKIAYINHDMEDSIRSGVCKENQLPKACCEYFTTNKNVRLTKMIYDIVENSLGKQKVEMSKTCWEHFTSLRKWMFENIYLGELAKKEEKKVFGLVEKLLDHYFNILKRDFVNEDELTLKIAVCDYVSGMTDRFAVKNYKKLFIPKSTKSIDENDDQIFKLVGIDNAVKLRNRL